MLLFLDRNRKIIAYKKTPDSTDYSKVLDEEKFFYTGEFSFFMGDDKQGFEKAFYLKEDGTIRLEYEAIPPEPAPPLSEQAQIAIDTALNVEYIACLMEANL